jgi:hypothetical protein
VGVLLRIAELRRPSGEGKKAASVEYADNAKVVVVKGSTSGLTKFIPKGVGWLRYHGWQEANAKISTLRSLQMFKAGRSSVLKKEPQSYVSFSAICTPVIDCIDGGVCVVRPVTSQNPALLDLP